jgi:predicted SAM-dependent methyltransferase
METRLEKILACIEVSTEVGLEVGALVSPIVTPDMGNIRYIDHATTAELQAKYAHDPNVDARKIVNVDYVWGKDGLPELVGQDAPFDYLIASHVVEHVPDFIGWLKEIHAVLKVGGILSLAIPDKRYCFDYYRHPTQVADVVDAFLNHSRKPSPRQVFDYITAAVMHNGSIAWDCQIPIDPRQLKPIHSEQEAWQIAQRSLLQDQYVDAHCWVFTPQSFFDLLKSLIHLELLDFKVEQFYETAGCEFYVSLKALDEMTVSDRQLLQIASLPAIPAATETQDTKTMLLSKQKQIQRLEKELAAETNRISAMETSKFWKLRSKWFKLKRALSLLTDE